MVVVVVVDAAITSLAVAVFPVVSRVVDSVVGALDDGFAVTKTTDPTGGASGLAD